MEVSANDHWKLIVLHTNDSHGHIQPFPIVSKDISSQLRLCDQSAPIHNLGGFAYLASIVKEIRKKNRYTLLFDSGDTFSDTMEANITKGRLQLSLMNELGYDGMCPGNHDIDYGDEELKDIAEEADFPILAANLLNQMSKEPYLGVPYIFKNINGLEVGIYGLTYHLTPETTSKQNIENVCYTLDFKQIQNDINVMRQQGAELVLVLSHLGNDVDEKLAKEVEGISVILGGHSHDPIPLNTVNNVAIVQSPAHLTGLNYLELTFDKKRLTTINGKLIPIISEQIKEETELQKRIITFRSRVSPLLLDNIGYSTSPIVRNYESESPVDTLLGNSMRYFTQSEISILPGVGYGVTIPPGVVVAEQLQNFFPHQSSVYVCNLKGEDLLAALEQSIHNLVNPDVTERVGGLIQVTGIQFTYSFSPLYGSYIRNAVVSNIPVERNRYYRTVMNQLMVEGGHKYISLKNALKTRKLPISDLDLIKMWFKLFPITTASSQGWSNPSSIEDYNIGSKNCFLP